MNTAPYNNNTNSSNSFVNPKGRRFSVQSNKSNFSKNTRRTKTSKKKNRASKQIYEIDYSGTGIDLSKYKQIKKQIFCSFCTNQIMKSALNFSCNHNICCNCISRQILKKGFPDSQSKTVEGIINIDCPCNAGNTEIVLDELLSLLYIDEDCLNHGEANICPKCSLWSSVLSQLKICEIHRNKFDNKNIFETVINDYCYDCHRELCNKCIKESHNGHKIKPLEDIIKEIQCYKRKNQTFQEFYDFIKLTEDKFFKDYNTEYETILFRINEGIKLLNQIKVNFEEIMNKKLNYSKNIFSLLKYIYYFYYKDLATVKNNIKIIEFLFTDKYELQNVLFDSQKDFSSKINKILDDIQNIKIKTFDCNIIVKNSISNCIKDKQNAHNGYIFDILNLNDKYLLSAGEDRKIKIWSLDHMNLFTQIELDDLQHDSSVFSLCNYDKLKKFFSGSYGEIKIWSSEDFNLINTLYGHKSYITHMEIIQKKIDNYVNQTYKDYLCSCSDDKTIKIWDMVSLNCVCTLEGHKDKINYFIPGDQGFLISCSSDKSIKFWNVDEEKCYYSLDNAHDGPIYCLARTEDKKIISCSFSTIKKFDLENKKVDTIYKENNKGIYKLLILPGNKMISSSFKYIYFWDLIKNNLLYSIEAHKNYITCLLIIKDKLISSSDDGDIKMWD